MSVVSLLLNWCSPLLISHLQNENLIGMELKGVDGAGDRYFEGIDVTLICRTYQYTKFSSPPNWSYRINGKEQIHIIDENNPPEGLNSEATLFDCWSH